MPFGFVTLTVRVPTAATVLSVVRVNVSDVLLLTVTLLAVPPASSETLAPGSKLVPVTVMVVTELVVTVFGVNEVIVGCEVEQPAKATFTLKHGSLPGSRSVLAT